jgi:hypothetical protein
MVSLIREDFPQAEAELKRSTDLASAPDPVIFYRLGLSYSFQKKYDEAIEALDRASGVGGVTVTTADGRTRDLVAEAKDFVVKSREAEENPLSVGETAAPPPSEEPTTAP